MAKVVWADYALVRSSKDDQKQYRVQVNDAGDFRCDCKRFIFKQKHLSYRTCRHVRWAARDRAQTGPLAGTVKSVGPVPNLPLTMMPPPVPGPVPVPVVPASVAVAQVFQSTGLSLGHVDDPAAGILRAMLTAGGVYVNDRQRERMLDVLVNWVAEQAPQAAARPVLVARSGGLREITLSDDDD